MKRSAALSDPFFTTKAEDKGIGLGLTIVYGIVMSHHGFIDVGTQGGHGRMGPPGLEPEPEKSEDTKEARPHLAFPRRQSSIRKTAHP
jgi:signal transduction histidine kinase